MDGQSEGDIEKYLQNGMWQSLHSVRVGYTLKLVVNSQLNYM